MISPINPGINLKINLLKAQNPANKMAFRGAPDTFEVGVKSVFGGMGEEELKELAKTVSQPSENKSSGCTSNIFRHNNLAVKIPKKEVWGRVATDYDFSKILKEFYALKEIEKINPDIAVKAYDVFEHKGVPCLVEDFVSGYHPHNGKITTDNLKDLLSKFAQLDKNGITSCDLQSPNIFLLNNGKTKLIDFGSYYFMDNDGNTRGSDGFALNKFQKNGEVYTIADKPAKTKFMRSFFGKTYGDIKNYTDNPYLNTASNAANFEYRTLYRYLKDGREQNPLEFFKEYVKNKGNLYHGEMGNFLKSLNLDEVITDSDAPQDVEKAKTMLKKAVNYTEAAKQVLSNPTDDVLKVELGKLQLKSFLGAERFGSEIPCANKILSAYNQLQSMLEQNIASSEGIRKDYYTDTLQALKDRINTRYFVPEQVEIPDNENLIKQLFPKTEEGKIGGMLRKINKKIYLYAAAAIALLGVGGALYYKNNQKENSEINKQIAAYI